MKGTSNMTDRSNMAGRAKPSRVKRRNGRIASASSLDSKHGFLVLDVLLLAFVFITIFIIGLIHLDPKGASFSFGFPILPL